MGFTLVVGLLLSDGLDNHNWSEYKERGGGFNTECGSTVALCCHGKALLEGELVSI